MKKADENRKAFRVPEDYFESLDTRLMTRVKGESKNGLKVPEGYFDDFEVNPELQPKFPQRSGHGSLLQLKRPEVKKVMWMAAAASILLIFGLKYMNTNQATLDWDDLEREEISSWIESDLAELNAYDIANAYPEVELSAPNLSSDELNAYLNETELDQILYEN